MLFLFKTLLFALVATCLIASTMAEAAPGPEGHVAKDRWTCKATQHGYLVIHYVVRIGRPYDKQKCKEAYRRLQRNTAISAYKCQRLSGGHMQLQFNNLKGSALPINNELTHTFPKVAAANGRFNCPNY
jgi:hypothetical protein